MGCCRTTRFELDPLVRWNREQAWSLLVLVLMPKKHWYFCLTSLEGLTGCTGLNCWWDQIVGEWGHSLAVQKGQHGPCSLHLPSLKEDGWEVSVSKDTCFCMKSAFPLKIWKAVYRRWLNVGTKIGCLCHTPGALSILGLVLWAVAFLQRSVWYSLIEILIADNDTVEWWPLIRRHTSRASNMCGNSAY